MANQFAGLWSGLEALVLASWPEMEGDYRIIFRSMQSERVNWTNAVQQFKDMACKGFDLPYVVISITTAPENEEFSTLHARAKSPMVSIYYIDQLQGHTNIGADLEAKAETMRANIDSLSFTGFQILGGGAAVDGSEANPANKMFLDQNAQMQATSITFKALIGEIP